MMNISEKLIKEGHIIIKDDKILFDDFANDFVKRFVARMKVKNVKIEDL